MPNIDAKLRYGPIHTNSNVICALDIRTGGTDPILTDLMEICVLPLNHSYRPHPEFTPFNISMKPSFPVDMKYARINKESLQNQYKASLFDQGKGLELLEAWWGHIRLKENKKMIILTWDWPTIKPWLLHWMGEITFNELIHETYRDLVPLMNFFNDRDDFRGDPIRYVAPTLESVTVRAGFQLISRNSLIANCVAMSNIYRKFLADR